MSIGPNTAFLRSSISISYQQRRFATISAMGGGEKTIKMIGISGSLRKGSFHAGLIRAAAEIVKESFQDVQLEHVPISQLPMLNTDLENGTQYPTPVEDFRAIVRSADAVLFASPEYNYSVTAPLKNALDWASRTPNVWGGKPAAIMSAGGNFGGGRSQYHLRQIGVYLDLHFINKPELFVHAFQPPTKFDADGNLIDPATRERVKNVVSALREWTLKFQK